MNLNLVCTPSTSGIPRWRYINSALPIYFNRANNKMHFKDGFNNYGFIAGQRIIILEHFNDPFNKILITLADKEPATNSFLLSKLNGSGHTSIACSTFYNTIKVPELEKTKKLKNSDKSGERGFIIDAVVIEYNNRVYFEVDFNNAKYPKKVVKKKEFIEDIIGVL